MGKTKRSLKVNRRDFLTLGAATLLATISLPDGDLLAFAQSVREKDLVYGIRRQRFEWAQKQAAALVAQMTREEKISQVGNNVPAIPRLGLPAYNYYSGEALHGLVRGGPVTSFPLPLALANTWNPELQYQVYMAVSDEARAYHNRDGIGLAYYSPQTVNTAKDPRWGRIEETLGEDPHLMSLMAVQAVRGMQGDDPNYLKTVACAKHYIANETDNDRTAVSETVDPRSFWEYYARPFYACVVDGKVFSVMGAYNAVNGIPCCADKNLLTGILRDRWGFKGYVTSDCDAIYNIYDPHHYASSLAEACAMGIKAGCDLDCGDTYPRHLGEAFDQHLLEESDLDKAVTRLLTARFLFGDLDPEPKCPYNKIPFSVVDSPKHRALALEAARQSIVLLKNDGILPLNKSALKSVAVIGPTAAIAHLGGYSGAPFLRISPLSGIAQALGIGIHFDEVYAYQAIRLEGGPQLESSVEQGGTDIGFIKNGSWVEFPATNFTGKNEIEVRVASDTQGGTIEIHLDRLNGPLLCSLKVPHTGGWQNWISLKAPTNGVTGSHKLFFLFKGGDGYLLNVAWYRLNPPSPPEIHNPNGIALTYHQGCTITGPRNDAMFHEAVEAARQADVAIVVAGVNQEVDGEGHDRDDIRLTGAQHELIQAVYQANPKTILVLSTNAPVAITWEQENLPAIVAAIFAGQAQGTAIADVLFGNYNPSGKLATTWYKSVEDLPDFHDFDITKRTYMYFEGEPLYPFGYGLSYTTFQIGNAQVSHPRLTSGGSITVSVDVTNTGKRAGTEVVQLYVRPPKSPVKRPNKQLVDFKRVELRPGETKRVELSLPYESPALWYWDADRSKFVLQPGTVTLMVGNSSAHIAHASTIELA